MKLTPRLEKISECVSDIKVLADIGTDHGYIPVKLVKEGRINKALACDVNALPLQKAEKLITENQLNAQIETRLGSGLSVLEAGEADGIVMAGMGGVLISELLTASEPVARSVRKLILQPMNAQNFLRHYLEEHGYRIIAEELAKEGTRVYEIMVVESGEMKIKTLLEYELGVEYRKTKNPLLKDLIARKLELEMRILKETEGKKSKMASEQHERSLDYIKDLKEVDKWLSE